MKCPKCSLPNPETQRFCGDCGTRLFLDGGGEVTRTTTIRLPDLLYPIGSVFAERYKVIEELGKGGMGRVIRALDLKLSEEIAIKFIRTDLTEDPAAVERFRTELKAARQVIHKNVARMFDLNEEEGVPFITMEYVRGGDLKSLIRKMGRLNAEQSVRIVKQVAEGLAEAHRTGVVHRDLKPHNIMVDEEGIARITDFGLARLWKGDDVTRTAPGMGTPAYVSPEQLEGGIVDGRSDLYSLGITLYEMLTGETPFQGDSPHSVAIGRLTKRPPDPRTLQPDIPDALVQVLMKCLERDPKLRYQKAEELIAGLDALGYDFSTGIITRRRSDSTGSRVWRWVLARPVPFVILTVALLGILGRFVIWPPSSWKTSIAVLPVVDMRPPGEGANLPYGLLSDINAKLTCVEKLRVRPWPSLSEFDYKGKNFKEIGRTLDADNLLKLTLGSEGTRLFLDADWIDTKSSALILRKKYPIELADINAREYEILKDTTVVLGLKLDMSRLTLNRKRETKHPDALDLYWEAQRLIDEEYFSSYEPEYFIRAVGLYEKALAIDPDFALAYWGLGNAFEARYNNPYGTAGKDPGDLSQMKDNYVRAHEIAPFFAETNLGRGWIYFHYGNNIEASKLFKRAYELEPDNFIVNLDVGAFLRSVGHYDKALKYLYCAAEILPQSIVAQNQVFSCLNCLGRFGKAYGEIEEALVQHTGNSEARSQKVMALIMMNRLAEAEREIETTRKLNPKKEMANSEALLWAARGEKEKALKLLIGKDPDGINAICVYIFLGMKEDAINAIEEGIEHGFEDHGHYLYSYNVLSKNPVFKRLKKEPRFQEILRRQKAKYEQELSQLAQF